MTDYPQIKQALRTMFNAEDGLPEEVSRQMLVRSKNSPEAVESFVKELQLAFADESLSWRSLLFSQDYEVLDVATEKEAMEFVQRNLLAPFTMDLLDRLP